MNSLTNILKGYPSFQPNQVLTSTHLNALANYMEQQDRLSRQKLVGIGIVCGLEVDLNSATETTIVISGGVGITSQGFLISLPKSESTHVRPYTDPAQYKHLINPATESSYPLLELLDSPGLTNDPAIELLSDEHIQDKVVVLYLEILEIDTDKCLDESCDDKGKRWQFEIRKLLIDQEVMERIIRESHNIQNNQNLDQYFNPEYSLSHFELERFGFYNHNGRPFVRLDNIDNMEKFVKGYDPTVAGGGLKIAQALHGLYKHYHSLFKHQLGHASNPFSDYDNAANDNPFVHKIRSLLSDNPLSVQSLYGFLHDIKDSYDELIEKLFELNTQCCPDENLFPRHLMLGKLENREIGRFNPADYSLPSSFRHHFIPSPIHDHQAGLLANIKQLIQRLVLMCESFDSVNIDHKEPVKITPSKDCKDSLGQRAIPYYYNFKTSNQSLFRYWDFDSIRQNRSGRLLGYHSDFYNLEDESAIHPQVKFPLAYDICKYPKLRIEGHIGLPLEEAIGRVKKIRHAYNLPFDIITLKLDSKLNNIQLADDSIIADIQAQYLVQRNEVVCCVRDTISILERSKNTVPSAILLLIYMSLKRDNPERESTNLSMEIFLLSLFKQFYLLYIDALQELVDELPLDIKDFNLEEFSEAHELASSMSALIKYSINTWGDIDAIFVDDDKDSKGNQKRLLTSDTLSVILNYFELFLDRMLDDCLLARFRTIHDLYIQRLQNHTLFPEFAKQNLGMEHISGVNKGGTFILVYEDKTLYKEVKGTIKNLEGIPLKEVKIFAATAPYLQYGESNSQGEYRIFVPKGDQNIRMKLKGYYNHRANVDEKNNIIDINLESRSFPTTEIEAEKSTVEKRDQLRDKLELIMQRVDESGVDGIKEILSEKASQASSKQRQVVNIKENSAFRVVGDFYLPGQISANFPVVKLTEACLKEPKGKMIDIDKISQEFKERISNNDEIKAFLEQAKLSSLMNVKN